MALKQSVTRRPSNISFRVIVPSHSRVVRDDLLKDLHDQKYFAICTAGNVCYLLMKNF